MNLVGAAGDPRFATFAGRVEHRDEVDALVGGWIAERSLDQVLAAFEAAEAAAAAVYDMADIAADPHYRARGSVVEVDGVAMQGLVARLSATPGRIGRPAPGLGEHTAEILAELDLGPAASPRPSRADPTSRG